jgi:hypothetical protein
MFGDASSNEAMLRARSVTPKMQIDPHVGAIAMPNGYGVCAHKDTARDVTAIHEVVFGNTTMYIRA